MTSSKGGVGPERSTATQYKWLRVKYRFLHTSTTVTQTVKSREITGASAVVDLRVITAASDTTWRTLNVDNRSSKKQTREREGQRENKTRNTYKRRAK
eukprot:3979675-Amphidinium_carterae.1